jgi:hypothetical protein
MYTERGHRLTEQLWEETLRELEFAQVQEILERMRHERIGYNGVNSSSNK